jgi:hypothetical protein
MGIPTPTNSYPNAEFQLLAGRRLLNLNLSHTSSVSICPAWPGNCSGRGGAHRCIDDAHLEVCGGVLGGHLTARHEELKHTLGAACVAVGAKKATLDATQDPATLVLLRNSMGRDEHGRRRPVPDRRGGDLLIRGANGDLATSKPTVVDVTVTSERAIRNRSLACAAEDAEKRKNDKYADLYARINYEFVGFAVEVGGRLGPSASTFLGKLRERWESKMGRRAVPEDANWSCPSFTSYWRQRIVASVQLHSASLFLARARRMAELQLAGAGQV